MNSKVFNYSNLIDIFGNIESERIGFYFSFCLHLIFLVLIIGFPDFFKSAPIQIPAIIPIEIVNISETTSITETIDETKIQKKMEEKVQQKKFNNLQTELAEKIETKIEPAIDNEKLNVIDNEKLNVKEKKKIEPNIKSQIQIAENKKNIPVEKLESLPIKKIKPRIKPKPKYIEPTAQDTDIKVKLKPKPSFENISKNIETVVQDKNIKVKSKPKPSFDMQISSMLKDIRNDQTLINQEKIEKDLIKDIEKELAQDKIIKKNENNESIGQLSISEYDLLVQQLSSCWVAPAGAPIKKGMFVKISARIMPNKSVVPGSVRIIDTNISKNNSVYNPITESAMRTLLNPECNPLKLPADKYDLWKDLTIIFDQWIMKGNQ